MNELFALFGSANVQKAVGLIGGPAFATNVSGLPMWARGALAIGGPVFAAFVHAVDAWRAKIEKSAPTVVAPVAAPVNGAAAPATVG